MIYKEISVILLFLFHIDAYHKTTKWPTESREERNPRSYPEVQKREDTLWHANSFDHGVWNRYELSVIGLEEEQDFKSDGIRKWVTLEKRGVVKLVGLGDDFIMLISGASGVGPLKSLSAVKLATKYKPSDVTLFRSWNETVMRMEDIAIVSLTTSNLQSEIVSYRITDDKWIRLWSKPISETVKNVKFFYWRNVPQLLIVVSDLSEQTNLCYVYTFELNDQYNMWYTSRMDMSGSETVLVNVVYDQVYFFVPVRDEGFVYVYKFSGGENTVLTQKLQVKHMKSESGKTFNVGTQTYVVVDSNMYRLDREKSTLVSVECCSQLSPGGTNIAVTWLPVQINNYRDDVLLLAQRGEVVDVVTWDGVNSFAVRNTFSCERRNIKSDWLCGGHSLELDRGVSLTVGNAQGILIPTTHGKTVWYKLSFTLESVASVTEKQLKHLEEHKRLIESQIEKQNTNIVELSRLAGEPNVADVERQKWNIGRVECSSLEIEQDGEVEIEKIRNGDGEQEEEWSPEQMKFNISQTFDNFNRTRTLIKQLTNDLDNNPNTESLTRNIVDGLLITGRVVTDYLHVDTVNNVDVDDVVTVDHSGGRKVTGVKTFETLDTSNLFFQTINNISEDMLLYSDLNKDSLVVTGDVVFNNRVQLNKINNEGLLDDVNVSTDVLSTDRIIKDPLKLAEVEIDKDLHVRGNVNKLPMILPDKKLPDLKTLSDVPQVQIENVHVNKYVDVQFVNDVPVRDLFSSVVWTNQETLVESSIFVHGTLEVSELSADTINGKQFPSQFVTTSGERPVHLTGEKLLVGDLTIDKLHVTETLNGQGPDEWITLSGPQAIRQNLTFDQVQVAGEFVYTTKTTSESSTHSVPDTHVFQNLMVEGKVVVDYLNGKQFGDLAGQVVYKDEQPITIESPKHFQSDLLVGDTLQVGSLNKLNISEMLTLDTRQEFEQAVDMFEHVQVRHVACGSDMFDRVAVGDLEESLVKTNDDEVLDQCDVVFADSGSLVVGDGGLLAVVDTLNTNLTTDDVLFYSDEWNIETDLVTDKLTVVGEMVVDGDLVSYDNKLNDMDTNYLSENYLSRTKPQTLTASLVPNSRISGSVLIKQYNDLALPENLRTVPISAADKLLQNKLTHLGKLLVFGNVTTADGINGNQLGDMFRHAVSLNTSHLGPPQDVRFKGDVTFAHGSLTVDGLINDVDLETLRRTVLPRNNSSVIVRSRKTFSNKLVVNNVYISQLNGKPITSLLTKNGVQNVTGSMTVNGNVRVRNGVPYVRSFNNLSLVDLHGLYVSDDRDAFLVHGDLNLTGNFDLNNLITSGTINGLNFTEFVSDVIFTNEDVTVTGDKIFTNVVSFKKNLNIEQTINMLDLDEFLNEVVLTDKQSVVHGPITIISAMFDNVTVDNDLDSMLISSCDVREWLEDGVPLNQYTTVKGAKKFVSLESAGDVTVDFINGRSMSGVVRLNKPQTVPGRLTFSRITTGSDVVVDGTVNERVLKNELDDTFMMKGDQELTGSKTFVNEMSVNGSVRASVVNGKLLDDVIRTDTEQVVEGQVKFAGDVDVNNIRVDKINSVDFDEWSDDVVLLDTPQTMSGSWKLFGESLVKGDVGGENGTVNSVDLSTLLTDAGDKLEARKDVGQELTDEYVGQCNNVEKLTTLASSQTYIFKQFEPMQGLDHVKDIQTVMHFKASGEDYLVVSLKGECMSALYKWNRNTTEYSVEKFINLGTITKWATVSAGPKTYLITSSDKMCEDDVDFGNIWIFGTSIYQHASTGNVFTDILVPGDDPVFYTLDGDGDVLEWVVDDGVIERPRLLYQVQGDNFRFVPYELGFNVSVTDGHVIVRVPARHGQETQARLQTQILPGHGHGEMLVRRVDDKLLTVVAQTDKNSVKIYDDVVSEQLFDSMVVTNPTSLTWLELTQTQHYLLFLINNRVIRVHPYKGISKFQQDIVDIYVPYCNSITSVELPARNYFLPRQYLIIVSKTILYVVEAEMSGNPYTPINKLDCQ